jgi:hypothetical protein
MCGRVPDTARSGRLTQSERTMVASSPEKLALAAVS